MLASLQILFQCMRKVLIKKFRSSSLFLSLLKKWDPFYVCLKEIILTSKALLIYFSFWKPPKNSSVVALSLLINDLELSVKLDLTITQRICLSIKSHWFVLLELEKKHCINSKQSYKCSRMKFFELQMHKSMCMFAYKAKHIFIISYYSLHM